VVVYLVKSKFLNSDDDDAGWQLDHTTSFPWSFVVNVGSPGGCVSSG
jgi:hypothetical protein